MLQKWKLILTNWINCYFKESNKKDLAVNLESLLDVISHLRENLNNSISNSSILDANTVQEFLVEKYPDFKFENGSVEPDSEDEVYLAASLLLFFVCLNSKNVDLKNAMCSKLCPDDQETILKFSKHLMECSKITNADVQAAIAEACGQDMTAVTQPSTPVRVAETPPVLRSYHSEVRRLQAALDAERFDRNYLQEELTRTNLKVEKLLKDKEQYKLEIVDLKAQISLYCGLDKEAQGDDLEANKTSKLARQLEEMEQRLLSTQEQLDDVQYERETYKSKLTELKAEHDKLLALNQQESARANGLAEDLESERRHNQTLRDLVTELRQHNHLNKMDTSLLECDDPDASVHSLQHNSSACSEVCANVIEVQLGEERAKIVALRQQMQLLQEQLSEVTRKAEEEKHSLRITISEKESNIMELKHLVNEEIEENNNLKAIFNDEVSKLNNELNELEQRLKGTQENSRNIIENKMQEIQTLQEEKLSLLQSLSDETMKLENIIKDLQYEVDAEKSSKIRLREEYDNHIMKLNEKVLNRNNELVELQNKILEKGERIEDLQFELKREKELKDELSNKHNNEIIRLNSIIEQVQHDLQKKSEESSNLNQHLQQHKSVIEQINKDNSKLKTTIIQLQEECKILNNTKEKLELEITNRGVKAEQIYKETENLKNLLSEEKQKLQYNLEKSSATINALENQLQEEIQFKVELLEKLQKSEDKNSDCLDEITELKTEIDKLTREKEENETLMKKLNATLIEQEKINDILKQDLNIVNSKLEQLTLEVIDNNNIMKSIKMELENNKKEYQENLNNKNESIQTTVAKLEREIAQRDVLQEQFNSLEKEKNAMLVSLNEKENRFLRMNDDYNDLREVNEKTVHDLQESLLNKEMEYNKYVNEYHANINCLQIELKETKNSLEELKETSNNVILEKDLQIQTLTTKTEQLEGIVKEIQETMVIVEKEKQSLIQQLAIERSYKSNLENEYLKMCSLLDSVTSNLNKEILKKNEEINLMKEEIKLLSDKFTGKIEEIKALEINANQSSQTFEDIIRKKCKEIEELQKNMTKLKQSNEYFTEELNSKKIAIKEMEAAIFNLDQKLGHDKAAYDKYKVETEAKFALKDGEWCKQNEELIKEKDILIQELLEERSLRKIVDEEKQTLLFEKGIVAQELEAITQQLNEEKMAKQYAEQEKANLVCINEKLQLGITGVDELKSTLQEQNSTLLANIQSLTQEIIDKQSIQKKLECDNLALLEENKVLNITKTNLLKENELINQKLIDIENQKACLRNQYETELLESNKRKEVLNKENNTLVSEKDNLMQQIITEGQIQKMLKDQNVHLLQETDKLRCEKESLMQENEATKIEIDNIKECINTLTSDNNMLTAEKEELTNSLSEIKANNHTLSIKMQEFTTEFSSLLKEKQEEISKIISDYSNLKLDYKKLEDKLVEIDSALDRGLQSLMRVVKEEVSDKSSELPTLNEMGSHAKCDYINTLASILSAELVARKNLEKKLQSELKSVNDIVEEKEIHIAHLQNETRRGFEDLRNDQRQFKYSFDSMLESKNRDIQTLQHENQTLNNELNDVKIQLDTKVHSLKDKLVENEHVTDKLKKSYDSQIENLNVMINKLSGYLRDKTLEIDSLRKENEKLQKIVDDKAELIKSLEEEVKSLKNYQDKLTSDFESERLLLKNMVNVTESLMEDQKVSLLQVISEHSKANDILKEENKSLQTLLDNEKKNAETQIKDITQCVEDTRNEWKIKRDEVETELTNEIEKLKTELVDKTDQNTKLECMLQEKIQICNETQATIKALKDEIHDLNKQKTDLELERNECVKKLNEVTLKLDENVQKEIELAQLKHDNAQLLDALESKKSEIVKLESLLMYEKEQNELLQDDGNNEKINLTNKCAILQVYQSKAEQELESRQKEIDTLISNIKIEKETYEKNLNEKDEVISRLRQEMYTKINEVTQELIEEREKCLKERELKAAAVYELRQKLDDVTRCETDTVKLLRKEIEVLKKTLSLKDSYAVASQEKSSSKNATQGVDGLDHRQQVDNSSTDNAHSSLESYKTISDLEKIVQDRNRTITTLQSDITYMKSLLAESENNLLDVTKDLEVTKENCQQLSSQLKKIVHQKNEEIADLKKQVAKMSVNENRATQIIKVSAKYQAMILKRIAEIKSNTVLKELTNFGNTANCDNDLRRSLNAGTITMEDLENFLDTTDRHLKRCSEKQLALQKERDRLNEVNKINESEIINMRKFLTELSVSIKTFNSVKELYAQKLSRVLSLQRTVRREILSLEGQISDATMCKLQRDYTSIMQDLTECAMNMERWVERCLGRAISAEKIKQAFSSEERPSLASATFQNTSLEVQLEELENYFCKLLEEVARAQKGETKDVQAATVMEVRAEYEDKLNRMKAKMKQLYQEQIGIFKEKQRAEILSLEQELQKAREKLEESSRAYEQHIKSLTTELWNVGEKFLMKKDEADWLRRRQQSNSLMSLQHVHSSGLVPPQEEPSRPSDTHSLRSLPVTTKTNNKNEGRALHMSDEEGEVFDNRCLRELAHTPARAPRTSSRDPNRLSELQWRNSLCPPHLKSSYPAETQFVPTVHEEDIKSVGGPSMSLGGRQRKEVGITAYKKPGPPTPSKQAGRLSATDSELRESLRVETEPNASRKTSTPSRIRSLLFRSNKADNGEGTPRSRRLSNMFRKK